jgi:hypothetical protein
MAIDPISVVAAKAKGLEKAQAWGGGEADLTSSQLIMGSRPSLCIPHNSAVLPGHLTNTGGEGWR